MLRTETRIQPKTGTMLALLSEGLRSPRYDRLDVAVAYITTSGVDVLQRDHQDDFARLDTRWLTSIDWCRSDAVALSALDAQAGSDVKVHQGETVVGRAGCVPVLSYHPKGFLFSGADARLLVSGSGNLSRNGLTRGVELNTVLEVRDPKTSKEKAAWAATDAVGSWFDDAWYEASPYGPLHDEYVWQRRATVPTPPVTDDDTLPAGTGRGFSAADLVRIRRATTFWMEMGKGTPNLGVGNPGSQLMAKALTRVFFGFSADRVERMSPIGTIQVVYGGVVTSDLSIEHAHNGMDRINLPRPGVGGPDAYDHETIVFRKTVRMGQVVYGLSLADVPERRSLQRGSTREGTAFVMPTLGRRFGFLA